MSVQNDELTRADLVAKLGDTVGQDKAEKLVEGAMEETDVTEVDFDKDAAIEVLEHIGQMDDASSLVSVAANTTITQLR